MRPSLFAVALLVFSLSCAVADEGLPNFHKVDDHVYRGGQPDDAAFAQLAGMGIKTVIDLRGAEHSEAKEKGLVEAAGMRYVSIPMWGMRTPSDAQVSSALKLMNDANAGPVFVHCKRGADRTGGVVACYRIEHDHWDSSNALSEARSLGMSWYQLAIQHYVAGFSHSGNCLPIPATLAP